MRGAISTARRAVEEGRSVDLLELESMAERLCLELAGQPRDAARQSMAELEELVSALDGLAGDVARAKGKLDTELQILAGENEEPA